MSGTVGPSGIDFIGQVGVGVRHSETRFGVAGGVPVVTAVMLCIRARLYGLRRTRCWIDTDFRRTVPAPDFSPGERVFKPARIPELPITGALALVRTVPSYQSPPALISSPRSHVLYQGTTLVGPKKTRNEGFSPWAFSLSSGGEANLDKCG
jgi:hypothetical protein